MWKVFVLILQAEASWLEGILEYSKRGGDKFMAKRIIIGLVIISLVTMTASLAFGYVTGGSLRLKCVEGLMTVTQLGNVTKTPTFLELQVSAYCLNVGGVLQCPDVGIICGNPNGWTSPGIQIADWEGDFTGVSQVDPSTVERNGKAYVGVNAEPTVEQLAELSAACPGGDNTNWTAIDVAILSQMEAYVEEVYKDDNGICWIKSTALFTNCYIPNLDTDPLDWYPETQSFEIREYVCDDPIRENYKQNPILYSSWHPGYTCPNVPINP